MFAQEHRLDRSAFMQVFSRGKRVHMPSLLLIYLRAPAHQVAVVVGKKVSHSAVIRNTLKRRLSAALYGASHIDGQVIVVAKPAARTYSCARLQTELETALERALGRSVVTR